MELDAAAILKTGRRLAKEVARNDVTGLSAEFAYRTLLAMFPFFIFLAAIGSFIASIFGIENPSGKVMDLLGNALPSDASSVLRKQLQDVLSSHNGTLLSFGILGAIWAASAAMNTVIKSLNRAYRVEETRPFWKRIPLAVGLTLLAAAFFLGSFVVLLLGSVFARHIGHSIGIGSALATVINLARLPVAFVLLIVATAFLYWAAPNLRMPFRWVTPGAVLFVIAWIGATLLFGLYVSHFGSYNATYGTLGGVIILLVWLYFTGFLFLTGAELNALLEAEAAPRTMHAHAAGRQAGEVSAQRERPARPRQPAAPRGLPEIAATSAIGSLVLWRALLSSGADGHPPRSTFRVREAGPKRETALRR